MELATPCGLLFNELQNSPAQVLPPEPAPGVSDVLICRPLSALRHYKRRCYMTHVGLICDRTDLQPLLPQVLVANEATLQAGTLAALKAACPPNVRLVRQQSSWNNGHLCALIVGLIMEALGVHAGLLQVVLILDAARLHFGPPMINACRRHGVWPLFVPAKLTWLLQPLDTHGFSLFKHTLRMAHRRARARSADGVVPFADFVQCIYTAIRTVLQGRRWSSAVDADGFGQRLLQLSTRVVEELQLSGEVALDFLIAGGFGVGVAGAGGAPVVCRRVGDEV